MTTSTSRRKFLETPVALTVALSGWTMTAESKPKDDPDLDIVGPKPGYSPQIGTLVSMMTMMRAQVLHSIQGLTQGDLDYLLDSKANSIGALLLHLAATDTYYH